MKISSAELKKLIQEILAEQTNPPKPPTAPSPMESLENASSTVKEQTSVEDPISPLEKKRVARKKVARDQLLSFFKIFNEIISPEGSGPHFKKVAADKAARKMVGDLLRLLDES